MPYKNKAKRRQCARESARRNYNPSKYQAFKAFLYEYLLEHPCVDCGESDPVVLQFDHVRGIKKASVTGLGTYNMETVLTEISKCDVRCANCHVRRHKS